MLLKLPAFNPAHRPMSLSAPATISASLTDRLVYWLNAEVDILKGICCWLASVCDGQNDLMYQYTKLCEQVSLFLRAIKEDEPQMDAEYLGTYAWTSATGEPRHRTVLFLSVSTCVHLTFEIRYTLDGVGRLLYTDVLWGDTVRRIQPGTPQGHLL